MSKTRIELLQDCWIPISRRLPPDDYQEIVCWAYMIETYIIFPGYVARKMAEIELGTRMGIDEISRDRKISHWMLRITPK